MVTNPEKGRYTNSGGDQEVIEDSKSATEIMWETRETFVSRSHTYREKCKKPGSGVRARRPLDRSLVPGIAEA